MSSEKLWTGILRCASCGTELNRMRHIRECDIFAVDVDSALATGQCPNGCYSGLNDLNIFNTTLEWEEESDDWIQEHTKKEILKPPAN